MNKPWGTKEHEMRNHQTNLQTTNQSNSFICKTETEKNTALTSKGKNDSSLLANEFKKKSNEPTSTPWLNTDGSKKTDKEISQLGKSWSAETWSHYLDSSVGILNDESLVYFENMDTEMVYERAEVLNFLRDSKCYQSLEDALLVALEKLSTKERLIIRESFWQRLRDREIAIALNTTHSTVRNLKHRAIKKIGQFLTSQDVKKEVLALKRESLSSGLISKRKQWLNSELLTFR